jgi:hypothetical protein
VARRDVEGLTRAHDAARSALHLDLHLARQGDALVVVQASRGADDGPDVL